MKKKKIGNLIPIMWEKHIKQEKAQTSKNKKMPIWTFSKPLALTVLVIISLMCGCISSTEEVTDSDGQSIKTMPGEEVTLSENLQYLDIPQSVISYGDGQIITLTDFNIEKKEDWLYGSVHYTTDKAQEFVLIVYITMPKSLLIHYFDVDSSLTFYPPNHVDFGFPSGYELKGGENSGIIEFSFPVNYYDYFTMRNRYDIRNQKVNIHVFCVQGKIHPRSVLPLSQLDFEVFQANSNVVELDVDF